MQLRNIALLLECFRNPHHLCCSPTFDLLEVLLDKEYVEHDAL